MKNILSFLLIIGCLIIVSSCKNDNSKSEEDKAVKSGNELVETIKTSLDADDQLSLIKNMTKINPDEVPDMKQDAEVIIAHRYKEGGKKSHIILDKEMWEYEFIFSGKKMSAPDQFAGYWIDFSDDLTYTYGHYDKVHGSGKYTYSLESGLLLLIDNSDEIKPQEFEAKLFDVTLIMDGNHIYRDNNYNAKLKRISERPQKLN